MLDKIATEKYHDEGCHSQNAAKKTYKNRVGMGMGIGIGMGLIESGNRNGSGNGNGNGNVSGTWE